MGNSVAIPYSNIISIVTNQPIQKKKKKKERNRTENKIEMKKKKP